MGESEGQPPWAASEPAVEERHSCGQENEEGEAEAES